MCLVPLTLQFVPLEYVNPTSEDMKPHIIIGWFRALTRVNCRIADLCQLSCWCYTSQQLIRFRVETDNLFIVMLLVTHCDYQFQFWQTFHCSRSCQSTSSSWFGTFTSSEGKISLSSTWTTRKCNFLVHEAGLSSVADCWVSPWW